MLKLSDAREGNRYQIKNINLKDKLKRKLLELGLIPGREIEVLQVAPLGGPLKLKINDYCLALRRSEASNILVENNHSQF